jgi:hypothetical protein
VIHTKANYCEEGTVDSTEGIERELIKEVALEKRKLE